MKPLSDSELQDWLDGQLNLDADQLDANAKKDAALYDKIYAELKADEHVTGATFGFSNKVMREVFLETERKKDRKQFFSDFGSASSNWYDGCGCYFLLQHFCCTAFRESIAHTIILICCVWPSRASSHSICR
jgi:hypothetical protein